MYVNDNQRDDKLSFIPLYLHAQVNLKGSPDGNIHVRIFCVNRIYKHLYFYFQGEAKICK